MTGSITTKLIGLLSLCLCVIIGSASWVDYRLSRDEILERIELQAHDNIAAMVSDLDNWLSNTQETTRLLARVLEQRHYSEDGLRQMLKDIVENNHSIFGAAIALNPTVANNPLGFAPYYYRQQGMLTYADLASAQGNYRDQAWYQESIAAGKPLWLQPYYDTWGGKVLMTTYAVPVYRLNAELERYLYAVVTADISLSELHKYLQRPGAGTKSFGILLSQNGTVLSSRDPSNIMLHYSQTIVDGEGLQLWEGMLRAALQGQVITRAISCLELPGNCIVRMGTLRSTKWPVAVVYSEDEVLAPLRTFQYKTAVIVLISLFIVVVAVTVVTRRITKPLTALADASDNIAQGNLNTPLPHVRGNDELARLVASFSSMSRELKTYIANLEEVTTSRSRLEGELAAAREIQMSMLPQRGSALEEASEFALWAKVSPAKTVGGDLYYYSQRGNKLFFAVGDVSDKGVPAALFMAKTISHIQQLASTEQPPWQCMEKLNNALEAGNDSCMFVTLFLGTLNLTSGELVYASAGHPPPVLIRHSQIEILMQSDGAALGLVTDQAYPSNSFQLSPGDRLAIYTDGIDEAFNTEQVMFGTQRMLDCLASTAALALADTGHAIMKSVENFAGAQPQSDDITLLLLELPLTDQGHSENFSGGPGLTSRLHRWLAPLLEALSLPSETVGELALVAEEIVTNVAKYAQLSGDQSIEVTLLTQPDKIILQIKDKGMPFNPLLEAQRAVLGEDTESAGIGGLGVHLATELTDKQIYSHDGEHNILRLEKNLGGDGVLVEPS